MAVNEEGRRGTLPGGVHGFRGGLAAASPRVRLRARGQSPPVGCTEGASDWCIWGPHGYEVAHAGQGVQPQPKSARPANRASECRGSRKAVADRSKTGVEPQASPRMPVLQWGAKPSAPSRRRGKPGGVRQRTDRSRRSVQRSRASRFPAPGGSRCAGAGRRGAPYAWGTGWRPDAPRERPVVQIGTSERCPVAAGQPVRLARSPLVAQQVEQAVHR